MAGRRRRRRVRDRHGQAPTYQASRYPLPSPTLGVGPSSPAMRERGLSCLKDWVRLPFAQDVFLRESKTMTGRNLDAWMWAEACEALARAERLQRQFFRPGERGARAVWEPPVDIFEHERDLWIVAALPGVDARAARDRRRGRRADHRRRPPPARAAARRRDPSPRDSARALRAAHRAARRRGSSCCGASSPMAA